MAEAREWYVGLRERELSWIRDGKDPEAEFDKLYDTDPEVSGMDARDPMSADDRDLALLTAVLVGVPVCLVAAIVVAVVLRRCWTSGAATECSASRPTRTS